MLHAPPLLRHHRYIFEEKTKKVAPAPGEAKGKSKTSKTEQVVQARLQVRVELLFLCCCASLPSLRIAAASPTIS